MYGIGYLFFIILIFGLVEDKRLVKHKNLKCNSLEKDVVIFRACYIKAVSREISEVTIEVFVVQKPVKKIRVLAKLTKREDIGSLTLFNISFDVCEFMKDRQRYPVASLWYDITGLGRFSNINHTCPYNEDIYIRNYRADDAILSKMPLIPFGDYILTTIWSNGNQNVAKIEVSSTYYERIDNGIRKSV